MEKLFENLLSNQTVADILVLGIAFIFFFFFFRKELRHEINTVKNELKAEIAPIKSALENHITETNKKIDRLSDRLDRLYEMLLKDKDKK